MCYNYPDGGEFGAREGGGEGDRTGRNCWPGGGRGLGAKAIGECCRAAAIARFRSLLFVVSFGLCAMEVETMKEGSGYDLTVGIGLRIGPDGRKGRVYLDGVVCVEGKWEWKIEWRWWDSNISGGDWSVISCSGFEVHSDRFNQWGVGLVKFFFKKKNRGLLSLNVRNH